MQGYYDASGISSDAFDQAVQVTAGEITLSDDMRAQGIVLTTSVATSSFYMGFNWLDPLLGGADPKTERSGVSEQANDRVSGRHAETKTAENARKLRQAISLAIDQEEFISIFQNGRGVAAQGPIPPGIFGHREGATGINPHMYDWVDGHPRRKPIAEAKRLLAEAGWPNGRNAASGEPLVINLDTTATGVGAKARIDWLNKQFAKIDTQLVVRNTDYNRFQEKVRKGAVQLFYFGWNADYPDPENFLFLLHGKQGKAKHSGENAANYENPEQGRPQHAQIPARGCCLARATSQRVEPSRGLAIAGDCAGAGGGDLAGVARLPAAGDGNGALTPDYRRVAGADSYGLPPGRPKADPSKARERSEPWAPLLLEKGLGEKSFIP